MTVDQLLRGTFHELGRAKRELAIYFAVFFALALLVELLSFLVAPVGLLATAIYFVGQYFLYREILTRGGMSPVSETKIFGFFAMALLLGIPIYFGLLFLLVPGVLLGAKWIMAPTYLVAEELNVFEAIGASWRASSNNLAPLALSFFLIFIVWAVIYGAVAAFLGGFENAITSLGGSQLASQNAFGWVLMHALPVLLMGLSITTYRALSDGEDTLVAVFE